MRTLPVILAFTALFAAVATAASATTVRPHTSLPHAAVHAATPSPLPWVEDDYPRALALARARHVPIFADNWAKWCHTCRSMRAFVFTDPTLARHAGQLVWLDLDTENPKNAEFRRRYPVNAFPSMLIIDPRAERVTLRWVGALTVAQLHLLLDNVAMGSHTPPALLASVVTSDSLYGAADFAGAARGYEGILERAPAGWPGRPRVIESLMFALSQTNQSAAAIALARASLPQLGRSPSALNIAAGAIDAAAALPESAAGRAEALREFERETRSLVTDFSFASSADDRSGAWIALLSARDEARDSLGHRSVAAEWSAFLDREAARAASPEQRTVFDSHRLSAYLELGTPERAIPMLQQSERDLPGDYNPPARLAVAYLALKRYEEALAASDRALARAYGPRKLLLLGTRADIYQGLGDNSALRRTVTEAIAFGEALPEGQRSPGRVESFRKRLAALPTP